MIDCYFTGFIRLAFRTTLSTGKNKPLEHTNACQCNGCLNFFVAKNRLENHLKICSEMPGAIYKFKNQNLLSFEDNFQYLGDHPFVAYFDFETTTGSGSGNYLDDEEMYPLCYCLIFCFSS